VDKVELTVTSYGAAQVVGLLGDVDLSTAPETVDGLDVAVRAATPPQFAILDLTGVGFVSALGARALCAFNRTCALRGICAYWVVTPGSDVEQTIDMIGLNIAIPIFGEVDHALHVCGVGADRSASPEPAASA
jgi:anti-anti-sigma factor